MELSSLQIKLQCITISMFFIDIYFNKFLTFFLIKNVLLLYNIYLVSNLSVTSNSENNNSESLLFYYSDCLTYEEIDYTFEVGTYLVNIIIDDSIPVLYTFSIIKDYNTGIIDMIPKRVSTEYNNKIFNTNLIFKFINKKVCVLPDTECIL